MGQQFKVGDRVVVVSPAGGSCGGKFFRAGNTGTVARLVGGFAADVRFDAQRGVLRPGEWGVANCDLRPLTLRRTVVAWFQRLRALSTNEGGR